MKQSESKFHHLLFGLAVIILASIYVIRNWGFAHDDSYITFRYADNWLNGLGLRFNPSEVYYGTTAAGYAVILALLSWSCLTATDFLHLGAPATCSIPNISVILSSLGVSAIVIVIYLLMDGLKSRQRLTLGLISAVSLFSSYFLENSAGHETNVFLGAIFLSSYLIFYREKFILGGIGLFLATTFRPDVLASVLVFLVTLYFLRDRFGNGWKRVIYTFIPLLILWLIFAKINLGSFLPGTMLAKKAQVALDIWPTFNLQHSGAQILEYLGLRATVFVVSGLFVFLALYRTRFRTAGLADYQICLLAIFAGQLLSYLGYLSLNVTYWSWYGVPPAIGLLCLGLAGWLSVLHRINESELPLEVKNAALVSLAFVGGTLVYPEVLQTYAWAKERHINTHLSAYDEMVAFIKKDAPNGAVIQMNEPGWFGFMLGSKYKINDELGLVTPGVAAALLKGNYRFLYRTENPDYLVCSWGGKYTLCKSRKLNKQYKLVGEFDADFWKTTYVKSGARLYKRVGGDSFGQFN